MEPEFKLLLAKIDAAVRIVESRAGWTAKEAAERYLTNVFIVGAQDSDRFIRRDEAATLRN